MTMTTTTAMMTLSSQVLNPQQNPRLPFKHRFVIVLLAMLMQAVKRASFQSVATKRSATNCRSGPSIQEVARVLSKSNILTTSMEHPELLRGCSVGAILSGFGSSFKATNLAGQSFGKEEAAKQRTSKAKASRHGPTGRHRQRRRSEPGRSGSVRRWKPECSENVICEQHTTSDTKQKKAEINF